MSYLTWVIVFFFVLVVLVMFVYFLAVKAFYWGDKKAPPAKREDIRNKKGED